jgi:hypothetical protein
VPTAIFGIAVLLRGPSNGSGGAPFTAAAALATVQASGAWAGTKLAFRFLARRAEVMENWGSYITA